MTSVLESVNRRTQMVGQNRLELLLFRVASAQLFAINVFKVREVLRCPPLTVFPNSHRIVRGVATIRGVTMPIMDLARAIGFSELPKTSECLVIITQYNRSTQGFLVHSVDRIVNMRWDQMHLPPRATGMENYVTAVADIDDRLVEVIDVEKILADLSPNDAPVSEAVIETAGASELRGMRILVADDSAVARKQIQRCAESLGIEVVQFHDGLQTLHHLEDLAAEGIDVASHYALLVSDIEMPEMDGYTLTTEIRRNPALARLRILLHTSLSGVFNQAMVQRVGADDFLAKFAADELAARMIEHVSQSLAARKLADLTHV